MMGLPCRLLAATNANDALHRALSTGSMCHVAAASRTASPSMDINVPYNLWRMLYAASGDAASVRRWRDDFTAGQMHLPEPVLSYLRARISSVAVSDERTLKAIADVHVAHGYVLDPHTAVGVAAARHAAGGSPTTVCLGVAHPAKFISTVARALRVDEACALAAVADDAHKCVRAVAALAARCHDGAGGEGDGAVPRGCAAVLRRGGEWTRELRDLIEAA